MTDWSRYDACDTCDADAGRPCWDLRYATRTGRFARDTPHRQRTMHTTTTTPTRTTESGGLTA